VSAKTKTALYEMLAGQGLALTEWASERVPASHTMPFRLPCPMNCFTSVATLTTSQYHILVKSEKKFLLPAMRV
jgi:hypothetical protein